VAAGVSPNHITLMGLGFSLVAGVLFARGSFSWGMFLWFSALMESHRRPVARLSGKASRFGALFDSTLDRYAEFFIFFGFLFHFRDGWMFWVTALALMGPSW
jgi:CDP-diacylglycerol--glycerol-3-phosphate 3-phosphatidyltransferase